MNVPGAMAAGWEVVAAAIDTGDAELVADRVLALSDEERRQVAHALSGHLAVAERRATVRRQERVTRRERASEAAWQEYVRRSARDGRTVYDHERWRWDAPWNPPSRPSPEENWIDPMRVAGAGTIDGPAEVVAWLGHLRDTATEPDVATAALERVLSDRPPTWQAAFATRAALELVPAPRRRRGSDGMAALVLAMLRRSGAVPPAHDPLVVAWVSTPPSAEDPLLDHLLPRLFEAEGVGAALRDERAAVPAVWPGALKELQSTGRIGRDLLLDGCLRRFLRGGPAADLRFFVRLHELLEPAYDEVGKRHHDYLRLLPAAPAAVAEPALRHVRRLAELEPDEVTRALGALLFRKERKLVTAGLTWLDEVARDPAVDLDAVASGLGHAFACESADVQGRAVRIAVKHAKRFTADGARVLRDAAGVLPQELGETLVAVFGGEGERDADGFVPVPLPAPRLPRPFPGPVLAVRDLAGVPGDGAGWEAAELWLAGVVRLYGSDREGLAGRLAEEGPSGERPGRSWSHLGQWAREIARLIVTRTLGVAGAEGAARVGAVKDGAVKDGAVKDGAGTGGAVEHGAGRGGAVKDGAGRGGGAKDGDGEDRAGRDGGARGAVGRRPWGVGVLGVGRRRGRGVPWLPLAGEVPVPYLFLLRRWAEVYDAIEAETLPPYLLAEPTEGTGHVDAGELVERLAGYERSGRQAMPVDLQQALLRLPRDVAPEVVVRARRLTSEAGRAAARWMDGGRPEPGTEIGWAILPQPGTPAPGPERKHPGDRRPSGTRASDRASSGAGAADRASSRADVRGRASSGAELSDREPSRVEVRDREMSGAEVSDGEAVRAYVPGREMSGVGVYDLVPVMGVAATGLALVDELFSGPVPHRLEEHDACMAWWPYVMPSHREAVAIHLVPQLLARWRRPQVEPSQAYALALAGGPAGEGVALLVAYFVADRGWSRRPEERAGPVVDMAARGDLDAAEVGRQLASLVRRTALKPGPVFETLESAAALGAHREVWRIMTGFLEAYLPGPGERPHTRHTQGLAFALRAARWAGARGPVPCVAEVAKRRASNNYVREARRLHTYLT
ncbi:DUF6493 family protein [Nonomuraea sp. NPDC050643]|uniref:DUF7824 domain-containing protein n=1 Tax=Nonomuraea sp. NPDC050643 TaxID=3155660 RepID=UPI0033C1AB21